MLRHRLLPILCLPLLLALIAPAAARADAATSWLLMARRLSGQDDLWARAVTGPRAGAWLRLTATADADERWPALSPDGRTLAYTARRDRLWDLYLLDLTTGEERRLTSDSAYEANPVWSPDGTTLAFASDAAGDMDIFLADIAAGSAPENITPGSKAQEFAPLWSPAGDELVYVSTRRGARRLFRLPVGGERATELPAPPDLEITGLHWDASSGYLLVQVGAKLEKYIATLDPETGMLARLTWSRSEGSAAWSPDGNTIAWADERSSEWAILSRSLADGALPSRLAGALGRVRDLTWVGDGATPFLDAQAERVPQETPPRDITFPPPDARGLVTIEGLDTLRPELAAAVADAYQALRARVRDEVGYDYLGRVSETHRPLTFGSTKSDFLSWHKAGHAVDTLLDLGVPPSQLRLEVVRDDRSSEVYWRIFLQCIPKDGSCGGPMLVKPWDFSEEARWVENPGEGGHPDRFWPGAWLDFTELAEDYGWKRIASYQDPEFDWRTSKTAIEFWHYERSEGHSWWATMQQVYDPERLAEIFTWEEYRARELPLWLLRLKGVPLPAPYQTRPVDLVVP